ncbi:MAG: ABC transporter ATP-binding protein [Candidatus Choladocola sp.]|nr:ABC transporter ATP-binding protein [Candidatus Choladocola sp.]
MAKIELCNITKKFGDVVALSDINLTVEDNEFFVLFGPAGAGKTTLLKTIAGAEFPEKGLVKIGGEIMNHVEPKDRNVSMVFENYALYPNLSVYDNIASPMRSRLYRKDEAYIKDAVDRVTKMMKINHLLDRKPSQLSNGQRQRVALGRCLVRDPNVFLMDEPLAHLDAKLRHFMRGELKEMQTSINSTTIYVTHDYMEAMSLADRIAVLNKGQIVQIGTAQEMYYTPCNEFVAGLFGEPEINLIPAVMKTENGSVHFRMLDQPVDIVPADDTVEELLEAGTDQVDIGLRGNDIRFAFERPGDDWFEGTVYANEPIGNKVIMTVDVGSCKLAITCPNDTAADLDQKVYIRPNMKNALYFHGETKEFITRNNKARYTGKKN